MSNEHDPYAPQDPVVVHASNEKPADAPSDLGTQQAETMPKGSTADVLEWVGDDKDRAQVALDTEKGHANPRKGLVSELEELLAK